MSAPQLPHRPAIKECCRSTENLSLETSKNVPQRDGTLVPAEKWRCGVCLCCHHVLKVGQRFEPGKVAIGG